MISCSKTQDMRNQYSKECMMRRIILGTTILFVLCCSVQSIAQISTAPVVEDTTLANRDFAKGEKLAKEAKYDSSNFYFEQASVIYENLAQQIDQSQLWEKYVKCYNNMGENLRRKGEYENAMAYLNKALDIGESKLGETNISVAASYHNTGIIYSGQGGI